MGKLKTYGGWALGILAVLFFAVMTVRAGVFGYLVHVDVWNGNVQGQEGVDVEGKLGADDGTHITKLTVADTLDVTNTVTFDGALNVGGVFNLTGLFTATGGLTTVSSSRVVSLVETGSVVTLNTSTVLTPAQVCDGGVIVAVPGSDSGTDTFTVTMPPSSTLFADCLTTNGDFVSIPYVNQSALTSTLLAVGTGGPASASSTLSVQREDTRMLVLIRTSSIGYVLDVE